MTRRAEGFCSVSEWSSTENKIVLNLSPEQSGCSEKEGLHYMVLGKGIFLLGCSGHLSLIWSPLRMATWPAVRNKWRRVQETRSKMLNDVAINMPKSVVKTTCKRFIGQSKDKV